MDISIKNMLTSAIIAANVSVFDKSQSDSDLTGMGTTVVVAMIVNRQRNRHYYPHIPPQPRNWRNLASGAR